MEKRIEVSIPHWHSQSEACHDFPRILIFEAPGGAVHRVGSLTMLPSTISTTELRRTMLGAAKVYRPCSRI